eukprot:scaffold462_cov195-Pinguiococcus_pyrenoidosus.AAC.74
MRGEAKHRSVITAPLIPALNLAGARHGHWQDGGLCRRHQDVYRARRDAAHFHGLPHGALPF